MDFLYDVLVWLGVFSILVTVTAVSYSLILSAKLNSLHAFDKDDAIASMHRANEEVKRAIYLINNGEKE